jgi:hypothetical protein
VLNLHAFNFLPICSNLVENPVASPSFLEGGPADDDAMMVDDDCK